MFDLVGLAVRGSCRKFCDNWKARKLFALGIRDVLADSLDIPPEQLSQLFSCQPHRTPCSADIQADSAIFSSKDFH